jgi:magnesium-protoporphyrin IX monomethyl ester (oxidative) cyclase
MKILLINPPQTFYEKSNSVEGNLPLGLLYVAGVLERAGYSVSVLDAFFADSACRTVSEGVVEVGMTYEDIKFEIEKRKPDIVGISNPFSTQIDHAKRVADLVKEVDSGIFTVVGGPHVSVVPKAFLEQTLSVDAVVMGEGEYTMLDLARAFEGKKALSEVEGIAYRHNGTVTVNHPRQFLKNLDELPYPAYHLVNMTAYLNPNKIKYRSLKPKSLPIITSRGCPYNCSFCSIHLHMGKTFRAHSPEYVADHIQFVMEKYGVKNVFFEDDNLTFDMKRMDAICDKILERKLRFQWETPNGVRADRISFVLLKKMKKTGCRSIVFGVESGDQWVSDNIVHKDLKLEDIVCAAKMCQHLRLKCSMFFIIGFPGETKKSMMQTADFALKLKKDYDVGMRLFVATPLFGTKLYDECVEKGCLKHDLTSRALAEVRQASGKPLIETKDFSVEDVKGISAYALQKYKKLALIKTIKNPAKLFKILKKGTF